MKSDLNHKVACALTEHGYNLSFDLTVPGGADIIVIVDNVQTWPSPLVYVSHVFMNVIARFCWTQLVISLRKRGFGPDLVVVVVVWFIRRGLSHLTKSECLHLMFYASVSGLFYVTICLVGVI